MEANFSAPKGIRISSCAFFDSDGRAVRGLYADREYVIAITVSVDSPVVNMSIGYNIKLENGVTVYGTSSAIQGVLFDFATNETKTARFSFSPRLALGTYHLSAGIAKTLTPEDEVQNYVMLDFVHDALKFVVSSDLDTGLAKLTGSLVSLKKLEDN